MLNGRDSLFAVFLGVALAGRCSVLGGVVHVRGRGMGMMRRFLMIAGLVVLGGFTVVLSGLRVVGGGVLVALGCFFRHGIGDLRRTIDSA